MVIPNGWSAKRSCTGETYYWPTDRSQGTFCVYPLTEDLTELQNTWAKLTYITIRRNGFSAVEESAILDSFRRTFVGDKFIGKFGHRLQRFAEKMIQALVLMRESSTLPQHNPSYPTPSCEPVPPNRSQPSSLAEQSTIHQYTTSTASPSRSCATPPPSVSQAEPSNQPHTPLYPSLPHRDGASAKSPPPCSCLPPIRPT